MAMSCFTLLQTLQLRRASADSFHHDSEPPTTEIGFDGALPNVNGDK
ncbi:hypothetical protein A2U01_0082697, partial [Trifolium medium]|nr:hypothetical protein [Trifolium medium]